MKLIEQYRDASARLRAIAAEPAHDPLRQRLLEFVRELEREADILRTVAGPRA